MAIKKPGIAETVLQRIANYPLEAFGLEHKPDDTPLMGANDWHLTLRDVREAREALGRPLVIPQKVKR